MRPTHSTEGLAIFYYLKLIETDLNMKKYISIWLLLGYFSLAAQIKTDTIINVGIYKSYYNYALKEPLYVTYTLFKGGGDCPRTGFSFKKCGINSATNADYAGSSYDKGHLANAEDFANNCQDDEKTFCYYNCVPQTVKLNRGIWKKWETKIRQESQNHVLFIIAGGIYKDKTIGENKIGVPDQCYKIVVDAVTKEIRYCLLFPNDNSGTVSAVTLLELKNKLGYDLIP